MDLINESFPLKLLMSYLSKDQSGDALGIEGWKQLEELEYDSHRATAPGCELIG